MINTKKVMNCLKITTHSLFNCVIRVVSILAQLILLLGAISAMIIAYKMFPEIAIIYLKPFFIILPFIFKIFMILIYLMIISAILYAGIVFAVSIKEVIEELKKKNQIKKEEFMKEIVSKIKRRKSK